MMDYYYPQKYVRHCYAQVQNLASGTQFLPPTHPPFQCGLLHSPMLKILSDNIEREGGYLWELVVFPWDEAIFIMQEWVLGETMSTTLQVILLHQ